MAYNKTIWENAPSTNTPINANNLNKIEEGIYQNSISIETIIPTGIVSAYGGNNAPEGWLICDGSAVSRTTYSRLFSAIGINYGEGDGTTTFNLPDLKGKVIVGIDSQDEDFDTAGKSGGSKYLQAHKHQVMYSVEGTGSKGNNYSGIAFVRAGNTTTSSGSMFSSDIRTTSSGDMTSGDSGNLQPYTVVNYIIKY